jgi:hypothetical protein
MSRPKYVSYFWQRHMHIKSKKKAHFCFFMIEMFTRMCLRCSRISWCSSVITMSDYGLDCRGFIRSSDTWFLFHFVQTGPFVQLTPSLVDIAEFVTREDARTWGWYVHPKSNLRMRGFISTDHVCLHVHFLKHKKLNFIHSNKKYKSELEKCLIKPRIIVEWRYNPNAA